MDKLYSRTKIIISKKKKLIIVIISIYVIVLFILNKVIYPLFNSSCEYKAKIVATQICTEETNKVMNSYTYGDLVNIQRDDLGNIKLIETNTIEINKAVANITDNIQKAFNEKERQNIGIRLGSLTGSNILSGFGPDINIRIDASGEIDTNIKSEFFSVGINQSIHRIYLDISCKVGIITPIKNIESQINNQVLLTESIIVGEIPVTYYNIDGLDYQNSLNLIR